MEERKHAVEVLKIVLEERERIGLVGQLQEDATPEQIRKDIRFPSRPLVVVDGHLRDHLLESVVPSLFVYPLDSFWRKDRES